jgi:hypothetical protein
VRQKLDSEKIYKTEYKDKLGHREDWGYYWRKEKIGEGLVQSDPKHILKMLRNLELS